MWVESRIFHRFSFRSRCCWSESFKAINFTFNGERQKDAIIKRRVKEKSFGPGGKIKTLSMKMKWQIGDSNGIRHVQKSDAKEAVK